MHIVVNNKQRHRRGKQREKDDLIGLAAPCGRYRSSMVGKIQERRHMSKVPCIKIDSAPALFIRGLTSSGRIYEKRNAEDHGSGCDNEVSTALNMDKCHITRLELTQIKIILAKVWTWGLLILSHINSTRDGLNNIFWFSRATEPHTTPTFATIHNSAFNRWHG